MKQIFEHYEKWEDYKNGMWRKLPKEEEESMLLQAIEFTGDASKYGEAMIRVINEWPITCRHNLTEPSLNKFAFIGHAACSLEFDCPEYITRMAWSKLTEQQRVDANKKANTALLEWRRKHTHYYLKSKKLATQIELY